MPSVERGGNRWQMARRELLRRLNVELDAAERPAYDDETVSALTDWICEAETFDQQHERVGLALDRLRASDGVDRS